jgi:hypothetical protein
MRNTSDCGGCIQPTIGGYLASGGNTGNAGDAGKAATGVAENVAAYGEVSNFWAGKWKGANGKWNSVEWGGNQWTGARASALKAARMFHLAGNVFFAADFILNANNIRNGYANHDRGAMVQGGTNIVWGAAGTFGGPAGLVGATIYTIASGVVQIPAVYNVTVTPIVNEACHLSGC